MLFDDLVEYTIERYAHLALVEGWKQYVWGEIKRLDEEPPWAGRGIKERFLKRVKSIQSDGANLHQL
jgi:hypothetical protein